MLFDLIEDPGEQHNLVDTDPTTAAAHAGMLDELMLRAAPAKAFDVESTTLDEETIERLKALGYISD